MIFDPQNMPPGVGIEVSYDNHEVMSFGSRYPTYKRGAARISVTFMGEDVTHYVMPWLGGPPKDLWDTGFACAFKIWLEYQLKMHYAY